MNFLLGLVIHRKNTAAQYSINRGIWHSAAFQWQFFSLSSFLLYVLLVSIPFLHPTTPIGEGNGNHSSILAQRVLWTEEPGGLLSVGLHRVRHDWSNLACIHALEKEMATHSSILAWRIPGMGEPGGLLSMALHRVGHDWSDLAAAAAPLPFSLLRLSGEFGT